MLSKLPHLTGPEPTDVEGEPATRAPDRGVEQHRGQVRYLDVQLELIHDDCGPAAIVGQPRVVGAVATVPGQREVSE